MRFPLPCVLLLVVAALATAPAARAQYPAAPDSADAGSVATILEPETDEEANHAPDPNRIPYETETGLGEHLLALPATLWSGLASVFREGVLYAEYSGAIERLQRRYAGPAPPPYGFTPTIGFGGRDGLTLGGAVFHNDVFGTGRHARVGGRYGFAAPSTYSVFGRFQDPALFGSALRFGLSASYESDGDERFYERGNDTPEGAQIEYASRIGRGEAAFNVPIFGPFSVDFSAEYKHVEIADAGDVPFPSDIIGRGTADMVSGGGHVIFDFSRAAGLAAERTYAGPVFLFGYRYGQDLGDREFAYHRLSAEWRQFAPIPFLAFDRRLAFRARYEKTHPPTGDQVPFYEIATLGGPDDLRGYGADRFRDEGYLLFNVEYRYPVWDLLDAVVFFDTGQVFQDYDEIDPADFHSNVGAGLRVYGRSSVAGRLEVAYSPEGVRVLARIGTTF
jgi:hypothetical protein